ncbi:nitrilase family protein [Aurantibacter sp.]|uniref:nitrilase family protein n=1 Tax=Aurantibacter sp. TaxID=2807103 RepID=UPI0035C836EA
MTSFLKIALVQSNLVWENTLQNRLNFTAKIESLSGKADLVVLPELFTSGFTMQPENIAETMNGETINWLKELTKKFNLAITGSLVIKIDNTYRNRLIFVKPSGDLQFYDKSHSFSLAGEDKVYTSGNKKLIIDYKGFKICPLICYDLRFPVFSRNKENYDVLLYVANWPKQRIEAWKTLLKARAIENMSYCVGVNRVGLDANNYEYSGDSAAYNVLGEKESNLEAYKEGIDIIAISKNHIREARQKLSFLNDMDNFELRLD